MIYVLRPRPASVGRLEAGRGDPVGVELSGDAFGSLQTPAPSIRVWFIYVAFSWPVFEIPP